MSSPNHNFNQENRSGILLFIVDDDPVIRMSLDRYLSKHGYRTRLFADGYEVLVALEDVAPALIISDIRMPKLDGLTLLKGLQNRESTKSIPVIFISGFADDKMLEQARQLGAKFFLFKPFPLPSLHKLIIQILVPHLPPRQLIIRENQIDD